MSSTSIALSLARLRDPEYAADPYPLYHELRSETPVYWDEEVGAWVLFCYADVAAALRDPQLSAERVLIDPAWFPDAAQELVGPPIRTLARQMIFRDPPDHTRLRRVWSQAFTPRRVQAMRQQIEQHTRWLLEAADERTQIDMMRDLALPLHRIVIFEMLGVPDEDQESLAGWIQDYANLLDGKVRTKKGMLLVLRSVAALMDYFRQLITRHDCMPAGSLLGALIAANEQGDGLAEEELLANFILLLVAGHESTAHLIGRSILALLQHPTQFDLLRANPSLIPAAVTETLRYDSPVQAAARLARTDLRIGHELIQAGQAVLLCLGAANRDPARFAAPDSFDIARPDNRPLSFGAGIHTCLGAALARSQAEVALHTILQRFPTMRLDVTDLEWEVGLSSRGLKALPVRCTP